MAQTAEKRTTESNFPFASESGILNFPLKCCIVSKLRNVRKRDTDTTELEGLIKAAGCILQNLIGFYQVKGKKQTGIIEIVGGGRRIKASNKLVEAGVLTDEFQVPVRIVSMEDGIKFSMMENSGRAAMHPADEFDAYKALIDEGKTVKDISAMFSVAPIVVTQRLKLSSISPKLVELFRNDEANFSELVALSVTDDHGLQEAAWESLPPNSRTPKALRAAVISGDTLATDKLALFVGVDVYQAAGGEVKHDLFVEHESTLSNTPLLQRLAMEKLMKAGEQLQADLGLKWVDCRLDYPDDEIDDSENLTAAPTVKVELPAETTSRISELRTQYETLLEEREELLYGTAPYIAIDKQIDAIDEEVTDLEYQENIPVAGTDEPTGTFLYISALGTVHKSVFYNRSEVVPASNNDASTSDEENDDSETDASSERQQPPAVVKERPIHSDSLTQKLTAHRTAALQKLVMDDKHVALAIAVCSLMKQLDRNNYYRQESVAQISINSPYLKHYADDIESNLAYQAARDHAKHVFADVSDKFDQSSVTGLFDHLLTLSDDELMRLLSICVGFSIETTHGNDSSCKGFSAVAKAVGLDMADWWKPTRSSYLSYVPSKRILAVVAEGVSVQESTALSGMKKVPLAEAAEIKLAETRWIPEILRAA